MTTGTDAIWALSTAAGLPLSAYRPEFVLQQVGRALEAEGVGSGLELARRLRVDTAARARFRRTIAISVSGMFRDPEQFELLEQAILPDLLSDPGRFSAWSAGCADGTELFSLAAVLERSKALDGAMLLGSDLLAENVELARTGARMGTAAPARMVFEQRDLTDGTTPPGRWRLILCRNVAIYLEAAARRSLHQRLASALAPGGVLMLGRSEALPGASKLGLFRIAPHAYRRPA